jgi:hypothetical protein
LLTIAIEAAVTQIVGPLIFALLSAGGAYLVTLLPGPLQRWLASGTHERDMQLLLGAMGRKAIERLKSGTAAGALPGLLVEDVIGYARANLPETIRKLAPDEEALRTMATAIVEETAARLRPRVVVPTAQIDNG